MNAATRALEAGDYETAVSRAYYAAYHSIIAVIEAREGERRSWSHRLPELSVRHADLSEFHDPLLDLYDARVVADYGSGHFEASTPSFALGTAEGILERAREIL